MENKVIECIDLNFSYNTYKKLDGIKGSLTDFIKRKNIKKYKSSN